MSRQRSSLSVLSIVLLAALLPGCAVFGLGAPLEKPTVAVDSVALSRVGFGGATGQVDFRIMNPNQVSVPLTAIDWELSVHGERAVTGRVELRQEIPAKGSAPVSAALQIAAADAIRVAPHLARGARDYRLGARLRFATPLGELSVDVAQSGTL
jgi:hypothetical protein